MPVIIGRRELIGPDRPFQRYPSDLVCPWAPSSRQPNVAIRETVRPEGQSGCPAMSFVGRAPRRREPSVEEHSTRKVVDWSGS
jgi:hypothetical protein